MTVDTDRIVISGIKGMDGEYELDVSTFTMQELRTIKRLSGVRAGELQDAFAAGDSDLVVAFAVIALNRAGRPVHEDSLWNAQGGSIMFEAADREDEEADVLPPASGPEDSASADVSLPPSGPSSSDASDRPVNDPSRIGLQLSEVSAA